MSITEAATESFLRFVNATGSPYHTVRAAAERLESAGFARIDDRDGWERAAIPSGCQKFYVTKGGSCFMAFILGKELCPTKRLLSVVAAAHTDSPCLRVRPNHDVTSEKYDLLGVDTYGGGQWHTWLDRGLGLAGKVIVKGTDGALEEKLVHIPRPLAIIPNLAIHLQNADERAAFRINAETHLRPLLGIGASSDASNSARKSSPLKEFLAKEVVCSAADIIDMDLCLMDATEARTAGLADELIESPRLDNVASVWALVEAMSTLDVASLAPNCVYVAVAFDHEEIGSRTFTGANSATLRTWLARIWQLFCKAPSSAHAEGLSEDSFLLSVDCAHAVHPNYADKYQAQHKPMMKGGVVIKHNSQMRYCTRADTAAILRKIAEQADVPVQDFVVRNDSPCGSTIGPFLSSQLGIRGADVGLPQLAMHSIRETCAALDLKHLRNFVRAYYESYSAVALRMTSL